MTAKRWNIGFLGTESRTLVEAGENERIRIEQIWICNSHGGGVDTSISHVPAGDDSAEVNFRLWNEVLVRADTTTVIDANIYLDPGDKITAFAATADHIVITLYGRSTE